MASDGTFSARHLRGILAERRITRVRFAAACGLHRVFLSRILNEAVQPGELAQLKIQRGIRALGLESELARAG